MPISFIYLYTFIMYNYCILCTNVPIYYIDSYALQGRNLLYGARHLIVYSNQVTVDIYP